MRKRRHHQPFNFTITPPENLIFEGGGAKGIAHIGALKGLAERGYLDGLRRVGGTSVGAITAALVALGCSPRELEGIIASIDLEKVLDCRSEYKKEFPKLLDAVNGDEPLRAVGQAIWGRVEEGRLPSPLVKPDVHYSCIRLSRKRRHGHSVKPYPSACDGVQDP